MVVLPRGTLLVFFSFARLAVTARAWSSSHSSFIVRLECGCFFLFCAETFAVCVHLRKEPSPSPLVQYSHAKFVQYFLPSMRDACCKPHTFGDERNGFTTKNWRSKTRLQGREKGPESGEGASAEAESSVLPSIVPWSQWLLPSWSSSWPVCSSCGTALVDHPQAYKPGCFQHCQWSWWAHRCCPQRFIVSYSGGCSPMTDRHREKNSCLNMSAFR